MTPAGWYADHTDPSLMRYWDGSAWTSQTAAAASSKLVDPWADIRKVGNRVVVPASSILAGFAPERCVPHGLSGGTAQITFASKTPPWVYVTLIIGLIWPFVIAALIRKTVIAPAWPVCQKCRDERRQNLIWMWVAIGAWLPALLVTASLSVGLSTTMVALLFFLMLLGPLSAGLWFRERANIGHKVGGELSVDGQDVSLPARVFPLTPGSPAAMSVPPEDPPAYFGG